MSRAAKELYISQPAVSMAIRQLEQYYGKGLFIRIRKGVTTTTEGMLLYDYVSKGLDMIDAAEKRYFEMERLEMGEIRIGASDTLMTHYLLPFIEEYNTKYGSINIKATNRTTPATISLLKRGQVDFCFVNLPIEDDPHLDIIECEKMQDILVGGSKYRDIAASGIKLTDISKYPLLLLEGDSNTRRVLDKYAIENGVTLNPNIELGSFDLLIKFAMINFGLTFASREFIRDHLQQETLFEIPLDKPPAERSLGLVKLKNVSVTFAAGKFIELILNKGELFT